MPLFFQCTQCGTSLEIDLKEVGETIRGDCGHLNTLLPVAFGDNDRYELRQVFRNGGMGFVFKAHDRQTGEWVAVKVPKLPHDARACRHALERFRIEIKSLRRLNHAHINRVIDDGEHAGYFYFTMPFHPGGTLTDKLRGAGVPDEPTIRERVGWLLQVADAMDHAHIVGVLHRDLKPSNLFFDAGGAMLVSDFGLALMIDDSQRTRITASGAVLGTRTYMAPEQESGDIAHHGPGCDVYSLGVLLYEAITGQTPTRSVAQAPISPRQINPLVATTIEHVCLKAMSTRISDRHRDMRTLSNALRSFLGLPRRPRRVPHLVEAGPSQPNHLLSGHHRIVMARIEPCRFVMGCDHDEAARPSRLVRITSPYLLALHPVTQRLYRDLMGALPMVSPFQGDDDRPVDSVSWFEAIRFCNLLSLHDKLEPFYDYERTDKIRIRGGFGYRLPTEAEWECACRAGEMGAYCYGDDDLALPDYAWFVENSRNTTHAVGGRMANPHGLHDLHGNVWEWCWDWYAPYPPPASGPAVDPATDPSGPAKGSQRILRGGCWSSAHTACRSATRTSFTPDYGCSYFGFRLARSLPD